MKRRAAGERLRSGFVTEAGKQGAPLPAVVAMTEHPSMASVIEYFGTGGNPPIFSWHQKWSYTASANFCMGVMPPSAMFGRSWLYVHSQRVAMSCTCSIESNKVRASHA